MQDTEADESVQCFMCFMGHVFLRRVLWCVWALCALPLKCLETCVLGRPTQYVRAALSQDFMSALAGALVAFALDYLLFLPWANNHDPSYAACTTYLSVLAWCTGHVFIDTTVFCGLTRRIRIDKLHPRLVEEGSPCRTLYLGGGGYLGVVFGLSVIFQRLAWVNTPKDLAASSTTTQQYQWCRASDTHAAELVYIPVLVLGMLASTITVAHVSDLHLAEGWRLKRSQSHQQTPPAVLPTRVFMRACDTEASEVSKHIYILELKDTRVPVSQLDFQPLQLESVSTSDSRHFAAVPAAYFKKSATSTHYKPKPSTEEDL